MNVAEFVAVLNTLEQDHQLVLDRVQVLKEMVVWLTAPDELDVKHVFGRLRELDNYFVTQLATHMDEEEKTLFPLLEQFPPDGPALADRLRQDHTDLRRKIDAFNSCLSVALDLEDRPPHVVLRDLLTDAWELWEVLDKHAHQETRGIHACLETATGQG
jgi:iron-sulfur cluster repair protein YtfE (RIC family)